MKPGTFARSVLPVLVAAGAVACAATPHDDAAETMEPEPVEFTATAYCLQGTTKSGVRVQPGIVAADPGVLPVGSVVRIEEPEEHAGIYTVLDTGAAIKGERLDIYLPDCGDAREFGRQPVSLTVLRHGWEPRASDDTGEETEAE
jgi:3D (Asp-Asp-Asp) domain-containing protein